MKKIISILGLFSLLFILSCKKSGEQNPLADVANLGTGSYPTLQSAVNLNFSYNSPTSMVSIKIDKYGEDIEKIELFVVKGVNGSPSAWKRIKSIPFTGAGTVLSATSAEVATALGVAVIDLTPGDFYTFYNRATTKSGKVYDFSNTLGALENNPNYNACFRWTAYITCPFVAPVGGNYRVIQDDWEDWVPGNIVSVLDGAPGSNTINLRNVWPNAAYGDVVNPLIVNIDPATGAAKVPLVTFANNYPGTATAQGVGAGDVAGYVFSCTGFITLNMTVKYNGTSQGAKKLILKKI